MESLIENVKQIGARY